MSEYLAPAVSYNIRVTPIGAIVNGTQTAQTAITVRGLHGFKQGDKFALVSGTDFSTVTYGGSNTVASATATVVTLGTPITVTDGDYLVNLQNDTMTGGTPDWDDTITTYRDPDFTDTVVTPTTDTGGEFKYYYRGAGAAWEVVVNSAGTIVDIRTGEFADSNAFNAVDFGLKLDTSGAATQNTRAINAAGTAADNIGLRYVDIPKGSTWIDSNIDTVEGVIFRGAGTEHTFVRMQNTGTTMYGPTTSPASGGARLFYGGLQDLWLDGNGIATTGIKIDGMSHYTFDNVFINDLTGTGFTNACIEFTSQSSSVTSVYNRITNCLTNSGLTAGNVGILFSGQSCNSNTIAWTRANNCDKGIEFTDASNNNGFIHCQFEGNATSDVEIESATASASDGNIFFGCRNEARGAGTTNGYNIVSNNVRFTKIIGPSFSGTYTNTITAPAGNSLQVFAGPNDQVMELVSTDTGATTVPFRLIRAAHSDDTTTLLVSNRDATSPGTDYRGTTFNDVAGAGKAFSCTTGDFDAATDTETAYLQSDGTYATKTAFKLEDDNGGTAEEKVKSELFTLASGTTSTVGFFPANSRLLGFTWRIITSMAGSAPAAPDHLDFGNAVNDATYDTTSTLVGTTTGSDLTEVTFTAAGDLHVTLETAANATVTDGTGSVRVTIFYKEYTPPTS